MELWTKIAVGIVVIAVVGVASYFVYTRMIKPEAPARTGRVIK